MKKMDTLSRLSFYYVSGMFTTLAGGLFIASRNRRPVVNGASWLFDVAETGAIALVAITWPISIPILLIDGVSYKMRGPR
jgi:hypothetical protein